MRLDDPRLVFECKKIVEQRLYDVSSFPDFILQAYALGIRFVQVYDNSEKNSLTRFYNLDDVVHAEERGEIEFLNKNEHLDHSNGETWCLQFTNGQTLQPMDYHEIIRALEPGESAENIICEGSRFRNAALALATLAGMNNAYALDPNKTCIPADYIEEPTPDMNLNNSKGIVSADSHWKNHRIDYKDKDGNIIYSLGLGNLSSRAHNPGNLVVNNIDSANKIGAIGYYQPGDEGNKFAVFPNDKAGKEALENWWFTGNHKSMTVNQLLPKFAPTSENNLDDYRRTMNRYCVPLDKPINDFTDSEKTNLMNAIKTHEGFHKNKAKEIDKYSTKK